MGGITIATEVSTSSRSQTKSLYRLRHENSLTLIKEEEKLEFFFARLKEVLRGL